MLRCVDAAGTHVWPAAVTCYQRDDIVVFANAIYDPLISQGWQRCDPELAYPGPCAATDADAGSGHDAGPVRDAGSVDDSP